MKPPELFSLLNQLKVYSNCDDLRVTFDGNIMGVWFYWIDKDFNVRIQFSEDQIRQGRMVETEDDFINFLSDFVNAAKKEWAIKYGRPFEGKTDGQDGIGGFDLGDIAV